jgi:hypothetical protein
MVFSERRSKAAWRETVNTTLDSLRVRAGVALAVCALLLAGPTWADPPGRVVRLAHMNGPVSFLAAGDNEWVQGAINRPLWTGDRLWTGSGARAELQIGGAALRIAPETSITVINFDDRIAQFEVTQGAVQYRVRTIDSGDTIEIDTPNLAFSVQRPGEYRVDVTSDGDATTVAVLRGEAQAFGAQNAYVIAAGTSYRFRGTDLTDYVPEPIARRDALDTWAAERVGIEERSQSARYVSPDMIGYSDLDANGTWRNDASYGPIWVPTTVAADWAPYRYGHWAWVDPWGWTWIDDASWGFAPFHYGRWAFVQSRWCWVPGPRAVRPVYAPALVAFIGGNNFSVSLALGSGGGIGWFPLGPGDVYRPAYAASREYFTQVNVTNTVVNVNNVTNIYNNPTTNVRYINATNVNAVTAVPTQAFVDARPVQRAAVRVNSQTLQQAQIVPHFEVAPVKTSIVGGAAPAQARPTRAVVERTVIAKQPPPPAPAPIEQRQEALKRQPGKPLEATEIQRLGGQTPAAKPNVTVAQPAGAPKPMTAAAPSTNRGGAPTAAPPAATAAQPPVAGAPSKAEEMRRGGPPPTTMGAEKQGPPTGRPEAKGPPPATVERGTPPPSAMGNEKQGPQTGRPEAKGSPPAAMERGTPPPSALREDKQGPQTGRPEAKGPPPPATERGGPPPTEARPRNVPPPSAAPSEPPGRAATARPEAPPVTQAPAGREQMQRGGPSRQPEPAATPPTARAPANVPPPTVQAPPQAQPRTESANVSRPPPAVQGPPPRPEAANAPPARPMPREATEPPGRQAQGAQPNAQPPSRQPPPQAAQQTQGRPADKGPPPKDKDKDKDKDKKDENR